MSGVQLIDATLRIVELERENAALREEIKEVKKGFAPTFVAELHAECVKLERENAALREENTALFRRYREAENNVASLMEENAALREDKERLDWLCSTEGGRWAYWHLLGDDCVDRSVIDAARKEAQP